MKKFCIFCGDRPETKTREHIIPLWLIKATGKPDRIVDFGMDFDGEKFYRRKYSYNSFHFPACDICNNRFSILETYSENVVNKILMKVDINKFEITTLLDWLDKIRVGLWLGFHQLDNNMYGLKPNFYVTHRLRSSDRMFALYRIKENFKGVSFGFIQSPVFNFYPACFFIIINQICIFNISTAFIFTRNLGFPFPDKLLFDGNNSVLTINKINKGTHKIKNPIYRKPLIRPCYEIYQAVWSKEIYDMNCDYYETNYVKNNTLDDNLFCSKLFLKRNNDITAIEYSVDTNVTEMTLLELDKKITKQTINTLNSLALNLNFTDSTTKETIKHFNTSYKKAVDINKKMLELRLRYLQDFE